MPDSLLDLADEIELIDLPPEELRKRLAEGKVYTPERVEVAANNFFRTGNLTALREMALRLTAEHVDHKLQDYMQVKRIAGPWKSGERLMVAVGPRPLCRAASALDAAHGLQPGGAVAGGLRRDVRRALSAAEQRVSWPATWNWCNGWAAKW